MAKVIYENPLEGGDCGCTPWVRVTRAASYGRCLALARKHGSIDRAKKAYDLLKGPLGKEDQEIFVAILLDVRLQLRGISEVHRGSRDRVEVSVSDVLRVAIAMGATGLIVAHNHPSGKCEPSKADRELTDSIREACAKVDITLLDHIVVGTDEFYSFAEGKVIHGHTRGARKSNRGSRGR